MELEAASEEWKKKGEAGSNLGGVNFSTFPQKFRIFFSPWYNHPQNENFAHKTHVFGSKSRIPDENDQNYSLT
jgi:2-succinyl-5-enolpyruvyl-6-hydroxy-3-cyclohexene-1-carboxylate synthase